MPRAVGAAERIAVRRPSRLLVLLTAVAVLGAGCAGTEPATDGALSGTVQAYAAASLQRPFDEIARAFEAENPGVSVQPVYDGSRTLATQIDAGAPADVFAAADERTMSEVGAAAPAPRIFAENTLVIVVPAGNPARVATLADLARVTTVLCAAEVPCGAASTTLLSSAGVTVSPASIEQNVTAVLTKVAAGEADAGLVYATDVVGRDDVEAIVPEGAEAVVNRYPIAALAGAPNPVAAAAFVDFVLSPSGQAILAAAGFRAP